MNKMTKIALATASVLSVGALTACQSTQASKDMEQSQHMHGHYQKDRHMTPEQREQFEKMRTERKQDMQDIKKACDGKAVGSAVQVKAGEQTLEGTCAISFKPNRDEMKRAELTQQYDQRLAERQARQQAATKACQGQTDGKAVQLKVGTQTVDGKCMVHFQPNPPVSAPNKAA